MEDTDYEDEKGLGGNTSGQAAFHPLPQEGKHGKKQRFLGQFLNKAVKVPGHSFQLNYYDQVTYCNHSQGIIWGPVPPRGNQVPLLRRRWRRRWLCSRGPRRARPRADHHRAGGADTKVQEPPDQRLLLLGAGRWVSCCSSWPAAPGTRGPPSGRRRAGGDPADAGPWQGRLQGAAARTQGPLIIPPFLSVLLLMLMQVEHLPRRHLLPATRAKRKKRVSRRRWPPRRTGKIALSLFQRPGYGRFVLRSKLCLRCRVKDGAREPEAAPGGRGPGPQAAAGGHPAAPGQAAAGQEGRGPGPEVRTVRRPLVTSHPPQTYFRRSNLFNLTPLTMCDLLCDQHRLLRSPEEQDHAHGLECDRGGRQDGRARPVRPGEGWVPLSVHRAGHPAGHCRGGGPVPSGRACR